MASPFAASPDLTVDDLIRIFNDPEGELLQYSFRPGQGKFNMDELFHMELPFDAIKKQMEDIKKDILDRLDPSAPAPAFEHVGSTSIRGKSKL